MRVRVATTRSRCAGAARSGARRSSRGCTSGSRSYTSSPAAKIAPSSSATASASSSTTGPARRVDEHGVRLHERQPAGVDQVAGVVARAARAASRCPLSRSNRVEIAAPSGESGRVPGRVQHLHAEPGGARGRLPGRCGRSPTRPSIAPCTSRPRYWLISHPDQRPARRSRSASDASRAAARIRRNATSAVVSSSTPGVLHTAMPCPRAAATSMLS